MSITGAVAGREHALHKVRRTVITRNHLSRINTKISRQTQKGRSEDCDRPGEPPSSQGRNSFLEVSRAGRMNLSIEPIKTHHEKHDIPTNHLRHRFF
jgi:hypothetical protein